MGLNIPETKEKLKSFSVEDLKTLKMMTDNVQLKNLIEAELVEKNKSTKSTN